MTCPSVEQAERERIVRTLSMLESLCTLMQGAEMEEPIRLQHYPEELAEWWLELRKAS